MIARGPKGKGTNVHTFFISYYSSLSCMLFANKDHVECHEKLDLQSLALHYLEILNFLGIFRMVVGFNWIVVGVLTLSLEYLVEFKN